MDKINALKIAREYVDIVKREYDIKRAVIFGSYAKGTNNDNSDIDIALVISNLGDKIDSLIRLMKLRRKIDLRIEPHPFDSSDFNSSNPIVNEILRNSLEVN